MNYLQNDKNDLSLLILYCLDLKWPALYGVLDSLRASNGFLFKRLFYFILFILFLLFILFFIFIVLLLPDTANT